MKTAMLNCLAANPHVALNTLLGAGMLLLSGWAAFSGDAMAAEPAPAEIKVPTSEGDLVIHAVNHGSFVMSWNKETIYVDPVGGAGRYSALPRPTLTLITHLHGDHFDVATLNGIGANKGAMIVPAAAVERLPGDLRERAVVLTNGQSKAASGIKMDAMPAYNISPDRLRYHPKGQGNAYLVEVGGKRVYISGDTEAVPEMLSLKNIEVAVLCMNLPYTMNVEEAARAVRTFRPKIVIPYHCRGSDVDKFKQLVGEDSGVKVQLLDWYKQ